MIYFSDDMIDRFIKEDIPYIDLTSLILDIGGQKGRIEFICREDAVICGTEEVLKIFRKLNITPQSYLPTGTQVGPQTVVIEAEGAAADLHMAWKASLNILEYTSGIATRTRKMLRIARKANPSIEIAATRKTFPGTRELSMKAVIAGGGLPHRLGLSETILVFEQHLQFTGGLEGMLGKFHKVKNRTQERKFLVEVKNADEAVKVCRAGVDGVQFDKLSPEELGRAVSVIRAIDDKITILAAGGINESNVAAYAQTGVDGIVTSALYFGRPVDMGVKMSCLE